MKEFLIFKCFEETWEASKEKKPPTNTKILLKWCDDVTRLTRDELYRIVAAPPFNCLKWQRRENIKGLE